MRRPGLLLAAGFAVAALFPAGAAAEISCTYNEAGAAGPAGNALAIGATTAEVDVVAVQRSAEEIVVYNDAMGLQIACAGGTPTATNIDTINFSGADGTSVAIDLRGGQFAPGASPGLSPEIEWNFDWQDGFLLVNSAPGADAIGLGMTDAGPRANLNRAFEEPASTEIALGGAQTLYLRGDRGDEVLSAAGSAAPFDEFSGPLATTVNLEGGGGSDVLHGGSGRDLIDAGSGKDEIVGGLGRDDVIGGGGADTIDVRDGLRDHVNCGSGNDSVRKDRKDKLLSC